MNFWLASLDYIDRREVLSKHVNIPVRQLRQENNCGKGISQGSCNLEYPQALSICIRKVETLHTIIINTFIEYWLYQLSIAFSSIKGVYTSNVLNGLLTEYFKQN